MNASFCLDGNDPNSILSDFCVSYEGELYRYALKLVGQTDEAKEMVDLAFAELSRSLVAGASIQKDCVEPGPPTYSFMSLKKVRSEEPVSGKVRDRPRVYPLKNWIKGVIRRRSKSAWRKKFLFRKFVDSFYPSSGCNEIERIEVADDLRAVLHMMEQHLSDKQRIAILMIAEQQASDQNISDSLGYPSPEAVRVDRHRGRTSLENVIWKHYPDLAMRLNLRRRRSLS